MTCPTSTCRICPVIDDDAIRRAVRRGVLRVAFTAAAWLLLALVVAVIGTGTVTSLRTQHFVAVVDGGIQAAHPEYDLNGMSCCGGISSVTVRRDGHVRAAVDGSAQAVVQVHRSFLGRVDVDAGDPSQTPVLRALSREAATKTATRALVDKLPGTVVASALVELDTPLSYDQAKAATTVEATAMILTMPFGTDSMVSWPAGGDLSGFVHWAGDLRAGDDGLLSTLDLPPSATLRQIARDPKVYGMVIDRATPAQLRSLLDNPAVRTVNLADIAFDPAAQVAQ